MIKELLLAAFVTTAPAVGSSGAAAPAVCASDCDEPIDAKVAHEPSIANPTYDAAVNEDVFNVHTMAAELCDVAQEQIDAGIAEDDMIDAAVVVFTVDAPLVTTEAGVWYLRGVLRGCVAESSDG